MACYTVAKRSRPSPLKGRKFPERSGEGNLFYGREHTLESKKRMGQAQKSRFLKTPPWNQGRKVPQIAGENHYLWKGTTPINKWIRNRLEYQEWRKAIFERDKYTCQMCGKRGGKLVVDHWPKSLAQLIDENHITSIDEALNCDALWDTERNRTLCQDCHLLTENFGRRNSFVGGGQQRWLKH